MGWFTRRRGRTVVGDPNNHTTVYTREGRASSKKKRSPRVLATQLVVGWEMPGACPITAPRQSTRWPQALLPEAPKYSVHATVGYLSISMDTQAVTRLFEIPNSTKREYLIFRGSSGPPVHYSFLVITLCPRSSSIYIKPMSRKKSAPKKERNKE